MASYENTTIKKMNYNGQKVKKWYHDGVKVFTAGNVVTYYFNPSDYAQEEVDSEASVLTPKTVNYLNHFSGWTFVGWREDKTASSSVLSSKVMGDEPITLYAVYKKTLTASFNGNGATSGSVASISGTQYYNNGNVANPTITLPACGYARTDYKFTGWNYGAVGAKITLTGNITVSAQWTTTVIRIIHNAVLSSGISRMVKRNAPLSDSYPNSLGTTSFTFWRDGDSDDSGAADIYYNIGIPAGKTVYYKLRAYGSEYTGALHAAYYPVLLLPSDITQEWGAGWTTVYEKSATFESSYTNPTGQSRYPGFRFGGGCYAGDTNNMTWVIDELYYYV